MMTERRITISEDIIRPQLLTLREFRPFKTSDEYLWAMKEDLSDWLNLLYPELSITPNAFMECLETGVTLCKHANNVRQACLEWISTGKKLPKCWGFEWKLPTGEVIVNNNARPETFFARDNAHNFITWCRRLGIFECLLFESDDLIMRKNEKNVILCLLEVARRGSHFGMATPLLVQFEKEIDRDIAKDTGQDLSSSSGEEEESFQQYGPTPQIITNDLRSLDEMVRDLVERCTCPTQFPMIRIAEGKYRIGNTKVMIYVRILRNHVMVRVGGGWDTLAHYLDKHDPCRCSTGHRATVSSRLIMKTDCSAPRMKVEYDRRDLSFDPVAQSTPTNYHQGSKKPTDLSDSSSEISDEGYKTSDQSKLLLGTTNGCETIDFPKGHHSRKSSVSRARSLSTDEDRPDSRSTDEEITVQTTAQRERPVSKSSSTGKVPRTHARSISCERTRDQMPTSNGKQPYSSTNGDRNQQRPKHPPIVRSNLQKGPTRSLSASGTTEFYGTGNHLDFPGSRYSKAQQAFRLNASNSNNSNGMRTPGKNTWNGPNGIRPRERPNLFHANFFNPPNQSHNNILNGGVNSGEGHVGPNLAEWIKKALELDSDADKISHIELAIKQFEDCHQKISPTDFQQGVSLPYNATNPTELSSSSQTIRKRKENGVSKIPKPNFY